MPQQERTQLIGEESPASDVLALGSEPQDLAISVHGVSKQFRLPEQRVDTVREHVLSWRARRRTAVLASLRDVTLEIPRGSCVGIVGRNGSGKSTLLRCIAGIYLPDAGEVRVSGRLALFIELGVGFDRELTARENLITGGMLFGLGAREVRARVDQMLSYAELERFADVKLKNFSSGMSTRLGFALVTHIDADVLLFDEVIVAGDLAFQQKCFDRLAEMRAEARTLVVVSHDMDIIQSVCDRAVLLEQGSVLADGEPAEVAARYDTINLGQDRLSLARRHQRQRQRASSERLADRQVPRSSSPRRLRLGSQKAARRTARIASRFAAVAYRHKYGDAFLGYAWAILRPLAAFGVMYVVFTRIAHFNAGVSHYAVYLLTSLVLWTFFLDATMSSVFVLVTHADLLRKIPVPRAAMPLSVILRAVLDLAMNSVAVAILVALSGIAPRPAWLELPLLIMAVGTVATGLALIMSALYVRLRDVDQLWATLAQVLFFASPILYVASSIPANLRRAMMALNPFAAIFTQMRHVLIDSSAPSAVSAAGGGAMLLVPCALTALLLGTGIVVFRQLAPRAAEDL